MEEAKVEFDPGLEDRFLKGCLGYPKLLGLCQDKLSKESFSTRIKSDLYAFLCWFYKEFDNTLPTRDILIYSLGESFDKARVALMEGYLNKLDKIPLPTWEWLLPNMDEQIRLISLNKALYNASIHVANKDYEKARDAVLEPIRQAGLLRGELSNDLLIGKDEIIRMGEETNALCCPTRIHALDDIIGGLQRKESMMIMAPLNVGKSWAIIHLAISALMSGRYVLYLTLEMTKDRVLQRILQNVTGASRSTDKMTKTVEMWDAEFLHKEEREVPTLLDATKVANHMRMLGSFRGKLSVREYPASNMSVREMERDIQLFDATFTRLPDLVLVDGLGDMAHDNSNLRTSLTSTVREFHRLANEYNCSIAFSHQANRESVSSKIGTGKGKTRLIEDQHTGESFGIVQVVDTAVSINHSKEDYKDGRLKMYVMRARNARKWEVIEIMQNLEIGQFCQGSKNITETFNNED